MEGESRLRLREESDKIDVRIPTGEEIAENPKRAEFVGGGWINSDEIGEIYVYWHRRQEYFTIFSLIQVLEHETLHTVLVRLFDWETAEKLDSVQRSACAWIDEVKLLFINEIRTAEGWAFPPYLEEPAEELLD